MLSKYDDLPQREIAAIMLIAAVGVASAQKANQAQDNQPQKPVLKTLIKTVFVIILKKELVQPETENITK